MHPTKRNILVEMLNNYGWNPTPDIIRMVGKSGGVSDALYWLKGQGLVELEQSKSVYRWKLTPAGVNQAFVYQQSEK